MNVPAQGRTRSGCAFVILALLLALLPSSAATAAEGRVQPARVEIAGARAVLPAVERDGQLFVSLRAAAGVMEAEVSAVSDGSFRLQAGSGREVDFPAATPALAQTPEGFVSLGADAIRSGGDLFVPQRSIARWLEPAAPLAPAVSSWEPIVVTMVGDQPGALRLSLDLPSPPRRVEWGQSEGERRWLLVDVGSELLLPWSRRVIDHDLLREVRLHSRGPGRFAVELVPGPGFRGVSASAREDPPGVDIRLLSEPIGGTERTQTNETVWRPVRRLVIDPGHGGAEDGAEGPTGLLEKEVVLDVARRMAARLRGLGYEVILTRESDEDLSLDDRAAVANSQRADLFLSIHANASPYSRASGAETYFLAREATDDAARTTAALENQAAGVQPDPGTGEELSLILWDMAQIEHLEESAELAELIQTRLNEALGITDRGVRQAPFRVLVGATCPAVLVELGFMTNRREEARLAREDYRRRLADTLVRAVEDYASLQAERFLPGAASR